eukprot:s71_g10.t1
MLPHAATRNPFPTSSSRMPPFSSVEAIFQQKYTSGAPPEPLAGDAPSDLHQKWADVRLLLDAEPTPNWATPRREDPGFDVSGSLDLRCGTAGSARPRPGTRQRAQPVRNPRISPPSRGRRGRPARKAPQRPARAQELLEPPEDPQEGQMSSRGSRSPASPSPEGRRPPSAKCPVCRATQPPWASEVDKAYTEGGVHLEIAPGLTERLRRLIAADEGQENFVWVVVESCTDCAQHGPSVRHDETNYLGRYQKLKEQIEERFPTGIGVAMLVEPKGCEARPEEEPKKAQRGDLGVEPTRRIGSFEVYMCCEAPLRPWGAFPLSQLEPDFNCVCLSSKLKSRAWPSMDNVMKRLCASMPQVMAHVAVHNELEWPLPFAQLRVQAADHSVLANGETDKDGRVSVQVPLFTPLTLKALCFLPPAFSFLGWSLGFMG